MHGGMFQRAHALGMDLRLNRLLWEKTRRERVAAQEKEVLEEAVVVARMEARLKSWKAKCSGKSRDVSIDQLQKLRYDYRC